MHGPSILTKELSYMQAHSWRAPSPNTWIPFQHLVIPSSSPPYLSTGREWGSPSSSNGRRIPFCVIPRDRCSSSVRLWDWSLRSVERSRGERRGLSCIEFMRSLGDHTNQVRNPGSFRCFPIQVFPRMSILPFPSEWMPFAPDYVPSLRVDFDFVLSAFWIKFRYT
jgi:hypothetical protein